MAVILSKIICGGEKFVTFLILYDPYQAKWRHSVEIESIVLKKVPKILEIGTCIDIAATKFKLEQFYSL